LILGKNKHKDNRSADTNAATKTNNITNNNNNKIVPIYYINKRRIILSPLPANVGATYENYLQMLSIIYNYE